MLASLIRQLRRAWTSADDHPAASTATDAAGLRKHLLAHPEDVETWRRLGELLQTEGQDIDAYACFEAVLRLDPDHFGAVVAAAGLAHRLRRHEASLRLYQRAMVLDPSCSAQVLTNVGVLLKDSMRLNEAAASFQHAINLDPSIAETHYNLACTLYDLGRVDEAEEPVRRAIALRPQFAQAHSTLLCIYGLHRNKNQQQLFDEHRRWAALHADHFLAGVEAHHNDRNPDRRLKIGYVSADLRGHSVAFFIRPVLARHAREAFHITCYDNWPGEDDVTRELRAHTDAWRKIDKLGDDAAARLIREDQIDILVDLSGHTAGNRLLVFARKPAPIQVTWLGYMCTTGLKAMDYRITDPYLDPPGQTEQYYTEKLARLSCMVAFEPAAESPEVSPLPALTTGHVTFGSVNAYSKVGDLVVETWAALLKRLPASRLILVAAGAEDDVVRGDIEQRFTRHGVDPRQLDIRGRRPMAEFLRMFAEIDIALDPFPYSGGTTSLHTLWMGVPIVAIEGESELARSTSGMMDGAGLRSYIAQDAGEYVRVAMERARDLPALVRTRAELRQRMLGSALFKGEEMVKDLEGAYRRMWLDYLAVAEPGAGR